jgi:RimJ/RimL family protein N-acetyltransferase
MVRAFVERLFLDPRVTKVQADPSPDNQRAIRSYLRAGFVAHGEVATPDGPALLMLRQR